MMARSDEKHIWFIDSNYNSLFTLPDGSPKLIHQAENSQEPEYLPEQTEELPEQIEVAEQGEEI